MFAHEFFRNALLAGTLVALARQGHSPMTAPRGATEIMRERATLESAVNVLAERAFEHDRSLPEPDRREWQGFSVNKRVFPTHHAARRFSMDSAQSGPLAEWRSAFYR